MWVLSISHALRHSTLTQRDGPYRYPIDYQHGASNMTSLNLRFYLAGYSGLLLPRAMRRLLARTNLHRAWLAGDVGVFKEERPEGMVACGVCDREWIQFRKGAGRAPAKLRTIAIHLISPFGR